jgi:hypothetical protein
MIPFSPKNQKIKTNAGISIDQAFVAHLNISAAAAVAASNTAVLAATNLGTAAQVITTGITSPAAPRGMRIKGNLSGVAGNVVIEGTNYAGDAIFETIALNGSSAVDGAKAFRTVTKITLPAESHTSAAQVETATVVGTISTAGNATVVITCTGMTGTPKTISVPVALSDNASAVAGKIRTALAADSAVAAMFTVGGTGANIVLTRSTRAANITNLNISIDNGTCAGLTAAPTSADTTAGVAYDTVSVGFSDVLGLPYKLPHNTVLATYVDNALESTAATVATSATAIESNTFDPNTALSGKAVDIYLLV